LPLAQEGAIEMASTGLLDLGVGSQFVEEAGAADGILAP
jgi:hypothetical protein